jgi:hypothetical protein
MNSACIIAACAANARRNNDKGHNMYAHYFTKDYEFYYKVHFRMYLHFMPVSFVKYDKEVYLGSIFAPYKQFALETATTEPRSIAKQWTFSIKASKCPKGPDKYVKDNLEQFTSSDVWKYSKEELIEEYVTEMQNKYNILIDKSALDYTVQYCWNVVCE